MVETVEANRDIIKGIKLRLVGNLVASRGIEVVKMAKKVAKDVKLPVMIHIGDSENKVSPTLTQEMLPLLEAGDILSHVFTARFGGTLRPDWTVMPELREAMVRGVVLDIAQGRFNFSYDVARKGMEQGILPATLSTDLTTLSLTGPTYGLGVIMSKFLGLGLDLKQVIAKTTINPARALHIEDKKGSLKPGMDADVSILELLSGTWELFDSEKQPLRVNKLLKPVMAVKSGQPIPSQPVAWPQAVN
jgi:dihydroorotase